MMQWIRLYVGRILTGTTFNELNAEERGVFFSFLILAGYSTIHGQICVAEDIGYSKKQLEAITKIPTDTLDRCIKKLIAVDKISIDENGVIKIKNWHKYQTEYERLKPYILKAKKSRKRGLAGLKAEKPDYLCYKVQWNEFAEKYKLPILRDITPERIKKIKVRENEKEWNFKAILEAIERQPFLLGTNRQGWKVNFDFIVESRTKYNKILEGVYGMEEKKEEKKPSDETIIRDEEGNPVKIVKKKQETVNIVKELSNKMEVK